MIATDKWTAEERIHRWEPSFPNGIDPGFLKALVDQTPQAWATPALVALNALVFLAMTIAGVDPWSPATDSLIKWGANYGPLTTAGQPWRLLTSAFVHFGAPHLVMNMVVLWQAGFLIERLIGNWSFLVAYLVSALCGSVASLGWNPYIASAGASGAVFGVFGILLGYLCRNRDEVPHRVLVRLGMGALGLVAFNLVAGFLRPGVDSAAHLGGLLAGFGSGVVLARPLGAGRSGAARGREILLLGVGLAGMVAALVLIPRTVDLRAEMAEFFAMQTKTVDLYGAVSWRRRTGELSDADFIKIVDEQIRPPWREHLRRLQGLRNLRGKMKDRIDQTEAYIELREQGWAAATEAVRTKDASKAGEAKTLHERAAALVKSIGEGQD